MALDTMERRTGYGGAGEARRLAAKRHRRGNASEHDSVRAMSLFRSVKTLFAWFSRHGLFEAIAILFTLVTVVNSTMMVIGWDRPKEGVFAYEHLLGRLGIVALIVVLWEFSAVSAAVRRTFRQGWPRAPLTASIDAVKAWFTSIATNRAGSVAVLYTVVVATVSVVTVAFQAFLRPMGGAALYESLLLGFVMVTALVYGLSLRQRRR